MQRPVSPLVMAVVVILIVAMLMGLYFVLVAKSDAGPEPANSDPIATLNAPANPGGDVLSLDKPLTKCKVCFTLNMCRQIKGVIKWQK